MKFKKNLFLFFAACEQRAFLPLSVLFLFLLLNINLRPNLALAAEVSVFENKSLPEMVNYIFNLAVDMGIGLAVLAIVLGGIYYLFSLGMGKMTSEGKEWVKAGILGLILLICSWSIMHTINPGLFSFKETFLPGISIPTINFPTPPPPPLPEPPTITFIEIPIGTLTENLLKRTITCYDFNEWGDPIDGNPDTTNVLEPSLINHDRTNCILKLSEAIEKKAKTIEMLSDGPTGITELMLECNCALGSSCQSNCGENTCEPPSCISTCDPNLGCSGSQNCCPEITVEWYDENGEKITEKKNAKYFADHGPIDLGADCRRICKYNFIETNYIHDGEYSGCDEDCEKNIEKQCAKKCNKTYKGLDEFKTSKTPAAIVSNMETEVEIGGKKVKFIKKGAWGNGWGNNTTLLEQLIYLKEKLAQLKKEIEDDKKNLENAEEEMGKCYLVKPSKELLRFREITSEKDAKIEIQKPYKDPTTNEIIDASRYCKGFGWTNASIFNTCRKVCAPGINSNAINGLKTVNDAYLSCKEDCVDDYSKCLDPCDEKDRTCKDSCGNNENCKKTCDSKTSQCKENCLNGPNGYNKCLKDCDDNHLNDIKTAFYQCGDNEKNYKTFQDCLKGLKDDCKRSCENSIQDFVNDCKNICDENSNFLIREKTPLEILTSESKEKGLTTTNEICYANFETVKKCVDDYAGDFNPDASNPAENAAFKDYKRCLESSMCLHCTDQYPGYPDCAKKAGTGSSSLGLYQNPTLQKDYLSSVIGQAISPFPPSEISECPFGVRCLGCPCPVYPESAMCPFFSKCPTCPCEQDAKYTDTEKERKRLLCGGESGGCDEYSYTGDPLTFYCRTDWWVEAYGDETSSYSNSTNFLENEQNIQRINNDESLSEEEKKELLKELLVTTTIQAETTNCPREKEIPVGQTVDEAENWAKELVKHIDDVLQKTDDMIQYIKKIGQEINYCNCDSKCKPGEPACKATCYLETSSVPSTSPNEPPQTQIKCVRTCAGRPCEKIINMIGGKHLEDDCPKGVEYKGVYYYYYEIKKALERPREDYEEGLKDFINKEDISEVLKRLVYSRNKMDECSTISRVFAGETSIKSCSQMKDYNFDPLSCPNPTSCWKTTINGKVLKENCYGQWVGKILSAGSLMDNWGCCETKIKE